MRLEFQPLQVPLKRRTKIRRSLLRNRLKCQALFNLQSHLQIWTRWLTKMKHPLKLKTGQLQLLLWQNWSSLLIILNRIRKSREEINIMTRKTWVRMMTKEGYLPSICHKRIYKMRKTIWMMKRGSLQIRKGCIQYAHQGSKLRLLKLSCMASLLGLWQLSHTSATNSGLMYPNTSFNPSESTTS